MTFRKNQIGKTLSFRFCVKSWPVVPFGLVVALLAGEAYTQTPPPITSSGLNTQITAPVNLPGGAVQHNIIGGTRPGGGGNLFHSFGEFGVPTDNIANFLNDSGLPTTNILSRVTGGNSSNILGIIQTEGFGNANLFLMNPAGIVFGPNASLNVGGATHFTTADYLQLADGVQFTALPGPQDALLSVSPVEAFGFLNSNPPVLAAGNAAAILVEGLDVLNGNPVSFVGRDATADGTSVPGVVITEGVLRNPGGSVKVASVGGQQVPEVQHMLVDLETLNVHGRNAQGLTVQNPVQLGGILLSEGGTLDASGEVGGSVVIRGGQLMINGGSIVSNTNGPGEGTVAGNPQAIGSPQTAIDIETESLVIQNGGSIVAGTFNASNGGDVRLKASESLQIREGGYVLTFTEGDGNAGNIEVDAGHMQLSESEALLGDREGISSQTDFFEPFWDEADPPLPLNGNTGNIRLHAQQLEISGLSRIFALTFTDGNAGNIDVTVEGGNLELSGGGIQNQQGWPFSRGVPGNINVNVEGGDVILKDGGTIFSTNNGTGGTGIEGGIQITAHNLEMSGSSTSHSSIISVDNFSSQKTGGISMTLSGNLNMQGISEINVISRTDADANDLNITAKDIFITGNQNIIATKATREGQGGNLNIQAENLTVTGQSQINSQAEGSGDAGNINVSVRNLTLSNGASVTAESSLQSNDAGNAGNIQLNAEDTVLITNSSLLTRADTGSGGAITVDAHSIELDNATLSASVKNGVDQPGGFHGDISLTTPTLLMTGGEITVETFGDRAAGTITLNTGMVLVQNEAKISALTSADGGAGSISIRTGSLNVTDGATLNSGTTSTGAGGAISVKADNITITGTLEDGTPSGVFSQTTGTDQGAGAGGTISLTAGQTVTLSDGATVSASSDGPGNAGAIDIDVTGGSFALTQGAVVNSGTTGTGAGGPISIQVSDNISIAGTLTDGTPSGVLSETSGSGAGGSIALNAGQNFTLSDGATVSASSDGLDNAGNINITAQDTILIQKASVTAEALQASGGNIKLTANDTIQLVDSTIASSVQGGDAETVGGDVTLDPDFIIAQHSQIQAKAKAGQGGNITLIAKKAVLLDAFTTANLDASSETGISGTVTIESPIQNLSGTIAPLPQDPAPVTALYGSRCVAGAGGHFSTFVDSKADSLAPTPGTFLASPFLSLSPSSKSGTLGDAGAPSDHATSLQVASYSPPVLFGHGNEMLSACP